MWIKRVVSHGATLACVLPRAVCRHYDIRRNDYVLLKLTYDNKITLEKIDLDKRPDLKVIAEEEGLEEGDVTLIS